ncbi:hypothetical protein DFH08DRAFT_399122 [Mycena albidolilacea]|uniref:Uncharacterized protein n=1 Tax=Mycena albidolilacea TaxID=1033008 RepID=A0AAD7EEJ0_9AGAR|nr:hypothetical protein DFH08DRAFT_399122 [Mycena albidolilacea]
MREGTACGGAEQGDLHAAREARSTPFHLPPRARRSTDGSTTRPSLPASPPSRQLPAPRVHRVPLLFSSSSRIGCTKFTPSRALWNSHESPPSPSRHRAIMRLRVQAALHPIWSVLALHQGCGDAGGRHATASPFAPRSRLVFVLGSFRRQRYTYGCVSCARGGRWGWGGLRAARAGVGFARGRSGRGGHVAALTWIIASAHPTTRGCGRARP